MNLLFASNSFLSIILFLSFWNDDFYILYNQTFFLKNNNYFIQRKIENKNLEKMKINFKSPFLFMISSTFLVPHLSYKIRKNFLLNEISSKSEKSIKIICLISHFFSLIFIIRNIFFMIYFKIEVKKNNIKTIHTFMHFSIPSYFICKWFKKIDKYCYDDGLKRYDNLYTFWMKKINFRKIILLDIDKKILMNFDNDRICFKDKNTKNNISFFLKISKNDCKKISKIFNSSPKISKHDNILFTQPLSEDGVISEERKIEIYKKIIKDYKINKIKPHPRENTKWDNLGLEVIDKDIPSEILLLEHFNIAVTLFSTSVLIYSKNVNKIYFLGTEIDNKLINKFGILKYFSN